MNTCSTCKWWETVRPTFHVDPVHLAMRCDKLSAPRCVSYPGVFAKDEHGPKEYLTQGGFGCIHHEAKE